MMECLRCGHGWEARVENPVRCPRCQSPYWGRERGARAEVIPTSGRRKDTVPIEVVSRQIADVSSFSQSDSSHEIKSCRVYGCLRCKELGVKNSGRGLA